MSGFATGNKAAPHSQRTLPDGWRLVRLGEILLNARNGLYKPDEYYGSGVRILKMYNIGRLNGKWELERLGRVRLSPVEASDYRLAVGDILLNRVNSRELVGKCAVVDETTANAVFESKNIRVRLRNVSADPMYVAAWLNSAGGRKQIEKRLKQIVGQATINRSDLDALLVPLPPLSEQQRIAAILTEQLAAVERARTAAEARVGATANLIPSYLRDAFHGVTPLAVDTKRDNPPTGWRWQRLTSMARLESGHTPSRYHPEWWGGTVPWIALPDIRNLDGKVAYETAEYTNDEGIAHSSARILPAGTVVLSRTASVGFVTVMGREMATSQDFVNWVCGPEIDPTFLAYLLRASRRYIRSLSSGAIHQTVYVPTVKAFAVCVPHIERQRQIAAALNQREAATINLRRAVEHELSTINALPAALLRRAFNGEL